MTKSFLISLLSLISTQAMAAEVISAKVLSAKNAIAIDVRYGGGCKKHTFKLEMGGCLESMPVQCSAKLVEKVEGGFDGCEALIGETVTISFADAGISGDYFSRASLNITGDGGSSALVTLPANIPVVAARPAPRAEPRVTPPAAPARRGANTRCVTHTGSFLSIQADKGLVNLQATDGREVTLKITNVSKLVLESNPPQEQNTYSLSDGRKVVTTFMDGQKSGTGLFIRTNGEASPEFGCTLLK